MRCVFPVCVRTPYGNTKILFEKFTRHFTPGIRFHSFFKLSQYLVKLCPAWCFEKTIMAGKKIRSKNFIHFTTRISGTFVDGNFLSGFWYIGEAGGGGVIGCDILRPKYVKLFHDWELNVMRSCRKFSNH